MTPLEQRQPRQSEEAGGIVGETREAAADVTVDLIADSPILDSAIEAVSAASGAVVEVASATITAAAESVGDIVGSLLD